LLGWKRETGGNGDGIEKRSRDFVMVETPSMGGSKKERYKASKGTGRNNTLWDRVHRRKRKGGLMRRTAGAKNWQGSEKR